MKYLAPLAALSFLLATASAQPPMELGSEAEKMEVFAFMNGEWRGIATRYNRDGTTHQMIQTERVGPMVQGDALVIEGRGYEEDGTLSFNAFATIAWDEAAEGYRMRSYLYGRHGDYPIWPTEDGFAWEVPAGPEAVIRYTAVVNEKSWVETGEYVRNGEALAKVVEIELQRIGDTGWPAAGAVEPAE